MNIQQIIASIRPLDWEGLPARSWGVDGELSAESAFDLILALGRARVPAFSLSPQEITAYRAAIEWLLADSSSPRAWDGLYVWGPPGAGKTLLVSLLLELAQLTELRRPFWRFCQGKGYSGRLGWCCLNLPLEWMPRHAKDFVAHFSATGLFLGESDPILHIEDLGVEAREAMHFGSRCEVLPTLLSDRLDQHAERRSLPVVITSNIPPDRLSAEYGERTASRILGSSLAIALSSVDHRLIP